MVHNIMMFVLGLLSGMTLILMIPIISYRVEKSSKESLDNAIRIMDEANAKLSRAKDILARVAFFQKVAEETIREHIDTITDAPIEIVLVEEGKDEQSR